jgi:hypothetical protein
LLWGFSLIVANEVGRLLKRDENGIFGFKIKQNMKEIMDLMEYNNQGEELEANVEKLANISRLGGARLRARLRHLCRQLGMASSFS